MKRDKAWLKEELMGLKCSINEIGKVRLGEVFELVDQLDEPEKVVVPSFIADYIERAKPRHDSLYQAMEERAGEEVNEWIQAFYNSDKFVRAWLYGYEVEKEKKYRVVFRSHKDDLILFKTGEHIFIGAESANNGCWKQHFTEVEIKAIDKRFWAFAEEVTE